MLNISGLRLTLCASILSIAAVAALPQVAGAQSPVSSSVAAQESELKALVARIAELEREIAERSASATPVAELAQQQQPNMPNMPMPAGPVGGNAQNPEGMPPDTTDPTGLLNRIKLLEQRVRDLESSTVLSDPETRVKRVEIYVDKNGNQMDHPMPGYEKKVTYERERVYRRQTINEKIEEALADADEHNVKVGVDAGIVAQFAHRTRGLPSPADHHAYELASADLFFTAGIAQNTVFFADVVGLSGPPPEPEIMPLTLVNGYSARLNQQNQLNLREAWLQTELFGQRLAVTAGRLDLTNYFDHNAAANDETSQFISDALVNNQVLGLGSNGAGVSLVFDPKNSFNFKVGFQQSNVNALSLNDSIFSLAEIGYVMSPFSLPEGNYRVWFRTDNSSGTNHQTAYGTSIDQKFSAQITWFGRFGSAQTPTGRNVFYSSGLQFANGLGFFPGDVWGVGYAQTDPQDFDLTTDLRKERLVEGYYSFALTERLKLSFHVQHFYELKATTPNQGFLVPGVRLQASF